MALFQAAKMGKRERRVNHSNMLPSFPATTKNCYQKAQIHKITSKQNSCLKSVTPQFSLPYKGSISELSFVVIKRKMPLEFLNPLHKSNRK